MKKRYFILGVLLLVFSSCLQEEKMRENDRLVSPEPVEEERTGSQVVPGVVLVKLEEEMAVAMESDLANGLKTRSSAFNSVMEEMGVTSAKRLYPFDEKYEVRTRREGLHRWYVLEYDPHFPATRAESSFASIPGVEIAESRPVIVSRGFDDPSFHLQWGLSSGGMGCDIQVEEVWKSYTTGSPRVVVAVMDEGIQLNHPDLKANMIPAGHNGSKNFVFSNYEVDAGNHGCHVAGVISAVNNNGTGVCGIAGGDFAGHKQGVRLMSCEILSGFLSTSAGPAFKWAADHGAVISQNSWGYSFDENEDGRIDAEELEAAKNFTIPVSDRDAIDYFIKYAGCDNDGNQLMDSPMKGGLVIFAAGNDDIPYGSPADYEPVIAVGALAPNGHKCSFSNYGSWVDISAPGYDVYSTYAQSGYGYMSGTSMACPHVSGVAALVLSYRGGQGFTNDMLKDCLLKGARKGVVPESDQVGPIVSALGAITYGLDATGGVPENPTFETSVVSNNVDFKWKLTCSPEGNLAYSHILMAAKDRVLLENLNPNDIPHGVVSREIIMKPGSKVGDLQLERLDKLDFESDYYVTVVAMGSGRVYDEKSEIRKVRTQKNNPPVIQFNPVGEMVLYAYEHKHLRMKVTEPDGNSCQVSFEPLPGEIILAAIDSGDCYTVTIKADTFAPGKYELVLCATDEYGLKTEQALPFEVLANRPPQIVRKLSGKMASRPGEESVIVLADHFLDPDHEALKYDVEVSDPSLIHYQSDGEKIYLTILRYGFGSVRITASDAKGLSASLEMGMMLRPAGKQMEIYPNPVRTCLHVRTGQELLPTQVEIWSGTGQKVFSGKGKSGAFLPLKLDVSSLAPGQYRVKVKYDEMEEIFSMTKR